MGPVACDQDAEAVPVSEVRATLPISRLRLELKGRASIAGRVSFDGRGEREARQLRRRASKRA